MYLKVAEASKRVWTSGCIEVVRAYAERNLYTIAAVALGAALSQVDSWILIFIMYYEQYYYFLINVTLME